MKFAKEVVEGNLPEEDFIERAKILEAMRSFKKKDHDSALSELLSEENALLRRVAGSNINTTELKIIETATALLEKSKELRTEYNKITTSKVDTNLLTGAPFFVGGSRKELAKARQEEATPSIAFEQGGIRKITYYNAKGRLLNIHDAKILIALFDMWEKQGKEDWLTFSEYQLLLSNNMGTGGEQYRILRNSLNKLRDTSIILQEAYDVTSGTKIKTTRFPLIMAETFEEIHDKKGKVHSKTHKIQFSPYIYKSMKYGYYSFVSLPLSDEIDTNAARAIYFMICGISSMDGKEDYIKEDGRIYEIPVEDVYNQLKLENPRPTRNKKVVKDACDELVVNEILKTFYFTKEGKEIKTLVLEPADWVISMMRKAKHSDVSFQNTQLQLSI